MKKSRVYTGVAVWCACIALLASCARGSTPETSLSSQTSLSRTTATSGAVDSAVQTEGSATGSTAGTVNTTSGSAAPVKTTGRSAASSTTASRTTAAPPSKTPSSGCRLNISQRDVFGNRSVSVLGDSITHGAGVDNVMEEGYINLLKKEAGCRNYGFASLETNGSKDIHTVHCSAAWSWERIGFNLGNYTRKASEKGAVILVSPAQAYSYFCVYYVTGKDNGVFTVSVDDTVVATVDTAGTADTLRTDYIPYSGKGNIKIQVASSGKLVALTGIGYYQNIAEPVINNYANNSTRLVDIDNRVLEVACSSEAVVVALGYNDAHFTPMPLMFRGKIDFIIEKIKSHKGRVIVMDNIWDMEEDNFFRQELKRLAEELGGAYIACMDIYGNRLKAELEKSDGVHPNAAGNRLLAEQLLKAASPLYK